MITMGMGQVNRCQVFAARHDQVRQCLRSFNGQQGIN
jgi:hypothetical protein